MTAEGQQQFTSSQSVLSCIVSSRDVATISENTDTFYMQ
jgi:hypothetical protein